MYCPECNREIPDESMFCPKCGMKLSDDEPVGDADGEEAERPAEADDHRECDDADDGVASGEGLDHVGDKKVRRFSPVTITAVLAGAVIAVLVAVISMSSSANAVVKYRVECYDDASGEALCDPEEGEGQKGTSIMQAAPPIEGYAFAYSKVNGVSYGKAKEITFDLDPSGGSGVVVEFYYREPSSDSFASLFGDDGKHSAEEAYRKKIENLIEAYGAPAIAKWELDSEENGAPLVEDYGSFVSGVSFVKIADFGAGHDSLLVVYFEPDAANLADSSGLGAFIMEVWDVNGDGTALDCEYSSQCTLGEATKYGCLLQLADLGDSSWGLLSSWSQGANSRSDKPLGFSGVGEFKELKTNWNDYQGKVVSIPLAMPEPSAYALQLSYGKAKNGLWDLGVGIPGVEFVPVEVKPGTYRATTYYGGKEPYFPMSFGGFVTETALEGSALLITGSLEYIGNGDDSSSQSGKGMVLGPAQWSFELDDDVVFELRGEVNGPREVNRDTFEGAMAYTGMGLIVEVDNRGLVECVAMSS